MKTYSSQQNEDMQSEWQLKNEEKKNNKRRQNVCYHL